MTLLDAGLKVYGLLMDLVKWRETQRDKRFKLVVQPAFDAMQKVHQDLLLLLKTTRDTLAKTQSFESAFEEFDKARLEHQGLRHEMHRRCQALLADPKLTDCHPFLHSVDRYFIDGPMRERRLSELTQVRLVQRAAAEHPNVPAAIVELDGEIKKLQAAWLQIADSHAAALSAML